MAATILSASAAGSAAHEAPKVVTSIKPVHSLTASIMAGVADPVLLIDGAASPHGFSLKPSQAQDLQSADMVIWVGPNLAPSLEKPLGTLAENAKVITLSQTPGITQLPFREDANFEAHDHGDQDDHGHEEHAGHSHDDHAHGEEKHDDHGHEDHAGHSHDDHAHDEEKHDDHGHEDHAGHSHDEHAHGEDKHDDHGHAEATPAKADGHDHHDHSHHDHAFDPHIWLDPENARIMAREIAEHLGEIDPDHASVYADNLAKLETSLSDISAKVDAMVAPVRGQRYVVFHDAYRYFEERFDLPATGAINLSPEVAPGAERFGKIQAKIRDLDVRCVFAEPQFEPKLVEVAIEGSNAKQATLDPLGATLENGPDLYGELILGMAESFGTCLADPS
nr:zinc ABC transporter substrate-binding protein [Roseibium hamelinense]